MDAVDTQLVDTQVFTETALEMAEMPDPACQDMGPRQYFAHAHLPSTVEMEPPEESEGKTSKEDQNQKVKEEVLFCTVLHVTFVL